jgi:hypothetical protein
VCSKRTIVQLVTLKVLKALAWNVTRLVPFAMGLVLIHIFNNIRTIFSNFYVPFNATHAPKDLAIGPLAIAVHAVHRTNLNWAKLIARIAQNNTTVESLAVCPLSTQPKSPQISWPNSSLSLGSSCSSQCFSCFAGK